VICESCTRVDCGSVDVVRFKVLNHGIVSIVPLTRVSMLAIRRGRRGSSTRVISMAAK
jgi:hypothetical protein